MKKLFYYLPILVFLGFLSSSCKTAGYGNAQKNEATAIKLKERQDAISYASLQRQQIPSFSDRATPTRGVFLTSVLGSAVSLATGTIKNMIAKSQARFTGEYSFGLTDLYFYDQLSLESVFDPVGLQFGGFSLIRTFVNAENKTDTALIARFELDTTSTNEIINNSIFRLKIIDIDLRYAKVKIPRAQKEHINMDFEISFKTSYVNELGQLFDNVELGKFYLLLRDAPLNKSDPNYTAYYEALKGKRLSGKSFIVPRSFGYYKDVNGNVGKAYSQGAYTITAKVKEGSKDKFASQAIIDNSSQVIDMIEGGTKAILAN